MSHSPTSPGPPVPGPRQPHQHVDRPPPIYPPDVVGIFDPAAAGGGGPLVRINTQRSIRIEQEARERAAREAQGLPAEEGIITRIRSFSFSSRPIPKKPLNLDIHAHPEAEHEHDTDHETDHELDSHSGPRPALSSAWSAKTLRDSPRDEKNIQLGELENGKVEIHLETCEEHVYPDGGYGWVVILCCATLAGLAMGWGMVWGVFQEYITANKTFDYPNQAVLSLCGTTTAFTGLLVSFIFGRMGDRLGFKKVLIASAFLAWASMFISAFSKTLGMFLTFYGVFLGIAQGMTMPLFMSLPSQWFYKRRGLASGLAIGGAGLGGGICTQYVRALLNRVGFKYCLIIMSCSHFFFWLLAAVFIRTRPTSPEARSPAKVPWINKDIMVTSTFWSLAVSLLVAVTAYGVPFNYLPLWVELEMPNISESLKVLPNTLLGFSMTIGRILIGVVADWIGPINAYILVFALSGVIQFAVWLTATTLAQGCVFAVLYGIIATGYISILPQIIVQLFGPQNLATNMGLVLLFCGPGNFIAGPLGGALYDATGRTSFKWVIIVGGSLQIAGAVVALWAKLKTDRRLWAKV
ncbi:hypothetical protein TREMEDRAFT_42241 [Tremella mesenterica DSM 1558]|nr:uncharacterized protein TREMEDRAFT_42241 [Tremella mesenterica DSM 1558]EIW73192.1 hypothetical protein TREMEDRAFT_42241 [Tremella mesenterica DSM 1558]